MEEKFFTGDKILPICAYTFLALPFLIFSLGYLKLYIGIPVGICICVSFFFAVQSTSIPLFSFSKQDVIKLYIALCVILIWVYLSGIGKFVWQNQDHEFRNQIFELLVHKQWPVASSSMGGGDNSLVYYIGFWLPAALIGKLFGLAAGFYFQYFWAVFGICCMFMLICAIRKKISLKTLIILIFFSGLDYIGTTLEYRHIVHPFRIYHMEWWSGYFQYSSMTTQLFWVFNQSIAAWVAVPLLLSQKSKKNIFFILGILFISSFFPFMGLLPIAAYMIVKNIKNNVDSNISYLASTRVIFNFQNLIGGGLSGIVTFLFFISSVHTSNPGSISYTQDMSYYWVKYAVFFILEAGIYLALVWKSQKMNPLYYILAVCLLVFPFFNFPDANFHMRASIPALFILMLMVIDEVEVMKNRKIVYAIILVLCIGSITPLREIIRTVYNTLSGFENKTRTEEMIMGDINFKGNSDSFFFQFLARN